MWVCPSYRASVTLVTSKEIGTWAGLQRHDGLLPRARHAHRSAAAAHLASYVQDVHRLDLHLLVGEGLFDGVLDLDFVGVGRDFEDVLALIAEDGALFRDDRADDGAESIEAHSALSTVALSTVALSTTGAAVARSVVSVRVSSCTADSA